MEGLTDEQKNLIKTASTIAIEMANWLGIDVSDIGYTFQKDKDGIWQINFTIDKEQI